MNNGGIKETAVCLKERTEVHQMQQSVTLYQWMNKIQELAQKHNSMQKQNGIDLPKTMTKC